MSHSPRGPTFFLAAVLLLTGNVSLSGSNFTFYNTFDASLHSYAPISLAGNLPISLSATTSGALAGMLFFQDRNAPVGGAQSFTGNANTTLTGALYFPRSQLENYTGNSSTGIQNIAIVADTISLTGMLRSGRSYSTRSRPANQGRPGTVSQAHSCGTPFSISRPALLLLTRCWYAQPASGRVSPVDVRHRTDSPQNFVTASPECLRNLGDRTLLTLEL